MFGLKRQAKLWRESWVAGATNTGNVTATVNGKLVLNWHGTPTQKDGALKMLPVVQQKLMPEASPESFADAVIASIHDEGIAQDSEASNIQSIAMLWRLFTTPVDHNVPGFTYGDLVAVKNFNVAFELHEQPNDQFRVTWTVNTTPGKQTKKAETEALRSLLQTKIAEYMKSMNLFALKDRYFCNAVQDDTASGRPSDEVEINRRRAIEAERSGRGLAAVIEALKAAIKQPTKADMIATMEHYVLDYGRDQAKRARERNATTNPRRQEQIDTEGIISFTVVTFLNNILAEVKD
jgi:hypothetical protein